MAKKRAKKEVNNKTIPVRNYIIAFLIVIGAILLTIYIVQLYNLRQVEKLSTSYLIDNNVISYEMKNIEELNGVLAEAPSEYFLYISYTGDKEIYDLEKDLENVIKEYNLQDKVYYLNVTDIMSENKDYLTKINNALSYNYSIQKIPTILFIRDGEIVNDGVVIREDNNLIQAGDFAKMLDQFEIPKSQ